LSFLIIRKKEPQLDRPFQIKGGTLVGIVAVAVALFMASLYLPIYSPTPLTGIEWALVGGWIVLGVVLFIINKCSANGKVSKAEIEYQMFGDDYKRF
ncbi:MAG: hypothetical protein MR704_00095, partial [Clostridia bacterium]|nr:hypothetical protein [Clostridia bacterium]